MDLGVTTQIDLKAPAVSVRYVHATMGVKGRLVRRYESRGVRGLIIRTEEGREFFAPEIEFIKTL